MHPGIRQILGRRVTGVVAAHGGFLRVYLILDDNRAYELWQHHGGWLLNSKYLDHDTALGRICFETMGRASVEAFLLDPIEQAEADRLIAEARNLTR